MQHFVPSIHESRTLISSHEWNKQNRDINADVTETFRQAVNYLTEAKVTKDMMLMLQSSIASQNRLLEYDDAYINVTQDINPDFIIFPSSAPSNRLATLDYRNNLYSTNIISQENQFALFDSDAFQYKVKPGLRINRQILPPGDKAYEVDYAITYPLTQGHPYIVRIPDVFEPMIEIIYDMPGSTVLETNYIYIQMYPFVYGTTLEKLELQDVTGNILETVMLNNARFNPENYDNIKKSKPIALPIQRTKFSKLKIWLKGLNYIEEIKAANIGLSRVEVSNVVYASESYIGFLVPMNGNRFINNLQIIHGDYSPGQDDVDYFVYDNITDFNNITNNYIAFNKPNIKIEETQAFVLVKIRKSPLETSPLVKGIRYQLVP